MDPGAGQGLDLVPGRQVGLHGHPRDPVTGHHPQPRAGGEASVVSISGSAVASQSASGRPRRFREPEDGNRAAGGHRLAGERARAGGGRRWTPP